MSAVAILGVVVAAARGEELGTAARLERRERSCSIDVVVEPLWEEGSMLAVVAGLAVEDCPVLAHQVGRSMSW